MHIPTLRGAIHRARILTQGRLDCFDSIVPYVKNKRGLEIGGPSEVFRRWYGPLPIYDHIASLDNCDISRTTVWAAHTDAYNFSPSKAPGKTIFCDGSDLSSVVEHSYDFILSSHNLEHFANPVKAPTGMEKSRQTRWSVDFGSPQLCQDVRSPAGANDR